MKARKRILTATLLSALVLGGCGGIGGQPVPIGSLSVEVERPLTIPAGFAHTKFQNGRQVRGVNRFYPWCELEIATVSEKPQRVDSDRVPVGRVSQTLIKDYISRIPALIGGLSCDDLVFQETIWWFDGGPGSPLTYLRCLAPYTNCVFGPPLSIADTQRVVGDALTIHLGGRGE